MHDTRKNRNSTQVLQVQPCLFGLEHDDNPGFAGDCTVDAMRDKEASTFMSGLMRISLSRVSDRFLYLDSLGSVCVYAVC